MKKKVNLPKSEAKVLFLFSDTGGGHRSAAEAIIEALQIEFGGRVETDMVDIFKQYSPPPLNHMPDMYTQMVRVPQAWKLGYHLSDGHHRALLINASAWPYVRRSVCRLVKQHPSDLIVSVHPLATAPMLRALGKNHPPFITIVTDLVSTHALWYNRRADLCIVPTHAARQRALTLGLDPDQVQVVGLPVADRFCHSAEDKSVLRRKLGWPEDVPMILLVGGGEGMGPLERTVKAIDAARLQAGIAVIAGRNRELQQSLEKHRWSSPAFVYGFVRNMSELMRAADVLVTKAGPGTISEAFIAGLPIILYSRLPGQEDGNVNYVISKGAGVWAPEPQQIISVLRDWITNPQHRLDAAKASRQLGRPDAARKIARILANMAGVA